MVRRVLVTLTAAGAAMLAVILLLAPQHGDFLRRDLPLAVLAGLIAAALASWF